jgi:hypothetical protein
MQNLKGRDELVFKIASVREILQYRLSAPRFSLTSLS